MALIILPQKVVLLADKKFQILFELGKVNFFCSTPAAQLCYLIQIPAVSLKCYDFCCHSAACLPSFQSAIMNGSLMILYKAFNYLSVFEISHSPFPISGFFFLLCLILLISFQRLLVMARLYDKSPQDISPLTSRPPTSLPYDTLPPTSWTTCPTRHLTEHLLEACRMQTLMPAGHIDHY